MTDKGKATLISPEALSPSLAPEAVQPLINNTSNLLYPLPDVRTPHDGVDNDGGWFLVDFCTAGATGSGSAQPPDCHHNDDDSAQYGLPFSFSFYGTPYADVFINNNGNLSFGQLFSTFTSTGFPVNGFPMVAPFWADVDTGDQFDDPDILGHVWYKSFGNTFVVTWDAVGYFNEQADKNNTFQVAISDGLNADMGIGNNVCFSYGDMQWTTGSASGGSGGFGGTPATVGVNRGNGVDFAQIGRFDHEGIDYDGPGGNNDGVSFLDDQLFCLNASGTNIPPIAQGLPPGNTAAAQCDVEFELTVQFIGPELGETVTVSVNDIDNAQAEGLVISSTPGNPATVELSWPSGPAGSYQLELTAVDDGTPPATTVETLTIVWPVCNQPPDCTAAAPSQDTIWPPNHKWVSIDVLGVTDPDGDAFTLNIDGIRQDEPVDTNGDGSFTPDGDGVGTSTAHVRAERAGTLLVPGDGRVYHIYFTATDPYQSTCQGEVLVSVPHDVKDTAIDGGPLYDSTALSP